MKSSKKKNIVNKKKHPANEFKSNSITSLDVLMSKRTGGAQNINGIGFQLLYSCHLLLTQLIDDNAEVRLEGVEDIDYVSEVSGNEFIQLKTSKNKIDAGDLWEMKVLQNFLEAYRIDQNVQFKLVHNSTFARGKLNDLLGKKPSSENLSFWSNKFKDSKIDISNVDLSLFFQSITFEKMDEHKLLEQCIKKLTERFNLNAGTEIQYFNSLFNNVFTWSKNRVTVRKKEIDNLMLSVTESFSKHPVNPAIQNGWILPVNFDNLEQLDLSDYFDGKAARPIHIANNLPVRRPYWEKEIGISLDHFDITLIRASSGQGKSTLGWLVSYEIQKRNYKIFELHRCSEPDDPQHIIDFIESRLNIGQIPLIVIDGLDKQVEKWGLVAERLKDRSVKFLITSREEDWIKYGYDLSKIKLKPVDIKLSMQEAQDVYLQLSKKSKIHSEIKNWQPNWEKVQAKGLLIEYVYLITKGQMITERLQEQIRNLDKEKSGAAKIEILRIISLADVMNIKLQTSKITAHINTTVKFESDRNEVYKQLEKEYFIRFGEQYVEGLHPVRSQHLVDILHSSISVAETAIALFSIIDETYIYNFFAALPSLISIPDKSLVYEKMADALANKKFSEVVYAIDGLMQVEAKRYWVENRATFDNVAQTNAIELFLYDTLPFNKLNMIKGLSESTKSSGIDLQPLVKKLEELSDYSPLNSDLVLFVTKVSSKIKTHQAIKEYEGLGFLAKWFKQLSVKLPEIVSVTQEIMLNAIRERPIAEAAELYAYCNLIQPQKYAEFINKHKPEVWSWIKRKTNSLEIEEKGADIVIHYLLDHNVTEFNKGSVYRINVVHDFFPNYERYCTNALILPFPNKDIYKVTLMDANKAMPKANLENLFDVHINQIWIDTIMANYRSGSMYEWQEKSFDLRSKGLEFAKKTTRLFEAHIERDEKRIRTAAKNWGEPAQDLQNALNRTKKLPKHDTKYFEKDLFNAEQKQITSWTTSLNNFINQAVYIITPNGPNARNLAIVNLNAVIYNLKSMQVAYNSIANNSFAYFPVTDLSAEEELWYNRLYKTILFYAYKTKQNDKERVFDVKKAVEEWFYKQEKDRLDQIHQITREFEDRSSFKFHLSDKIIYEENLKYAVIGVEGIDFNDAEKDILSLIIGLLDLEQLDIDFYTFVTVQNGEAIGGFRVNRNFIERVANTTEEKGFEESEFGNPIPIIPTEETIATLQGVKLKDFSPAIKNNSFIELMFSISKISRYREKLNSKNEVEKGWLGELECEYGAKIREQYIQAKNNNLADPEKFDAPIESFIAGQKHFTEDEIINYMSEHVQQLTNSLLFPK